MKYVLKTNRRKFVNKHKKWAIFVQKDNKPSFFEHCRGLARMARINRLIDSEIRLFRVSASFKKQTSFWSLASLHSQEIALKKLNQTAPKNAILTWDFYLYFWLRKSFDAFNYDFALLCFVDKWIGHTHLIAPPLEPKEEASFPTDGRGAQLFIGIFSDTSNRGFLR